MVEGDDVFGGKGVQAIAFVVGDDGDDAVCKEDEGERGEESREDGPSDFGEEKRGKRLWTVPTEWLMRWTLFPNQDSDCW